MTLLELLYFQKTAELQHLTKAAEHLHISQPSLSRTIKALESELEVPLFEHKGRNIFLTPYGKILLSHVNGIMDELDEAKRELNEKKQSQQCTVHISLFAASKLVPKFLMRFKQEYPQVLFEIIQQTNKFSEHSWADLALTSTVQPVDTDGSLTLFREELLVALPSSHPKAHRSTVRLADFKDAGFIALQMGKSLRTITDFYCHSAGFTPRIILESDSPGTVREFISAGLGISLVPKITWAGLGGKHIALSQISTPKCYRCINLSWKTDGKLSAEAELLKQYIIKNFAEYAKQEADRID